MNKKSAIAQYQSVDINSAVLNASPHKLISLLFEGFLKRVMEAKGSVERGDKTSSSTAIGKAIAIIGELQASLRNKEGNELSQQLDGLYDYINRLLLQAGREQSQDKLDEAAQLIIPIKESWDKIPAEYHNLSKNQAN
ncbi:Flagellar biosynthesis protein FliS [Marinobacterium lacunae]|uniref:Flagellar secretion chaperone FliS n=1 Tax=Marinobacterium lacunae TaxID=1232683 RepID=A0A081G0L4_9GAMM|nr:flagellar export chaperone FliS [Marinobacterium lacunae]KEA64319.1 Flagellar biosynthesis protein FliS [Marinobacterium lacunae]